MTKTEKALRALQRAVKKLKSEQGTTARRNARRAVGAAVRVLKRHIEEEYPSLVKPKAYKPLTLSERRGKLLASGYVPFSTPDHRLVTAMAEAGVRPVVLRWVENAGFQTAGNKPATVRRSMTYIPKWCIEVGADAAKLRKAKRSQTDRKAAVAEAALANMTTL